MPARIATQSVAGGQKSKVKITVQNSKSPLVPLLQRGKPGLSPFQKGRAGEGFYVSKIKTARERQISEQISSGTVGL
jgi:hypothetical protein